MDFKRQILILPTLLIYSFSNAQESDQIEDWVKSHPDVYIISSENYATMPGSFKERLQDKTIVFNSKLTLQDIQNYESNHPPVSGTHGDLLPFTGMAESQEAKEWLADHQEVQVISRSYYNSLSSTEQAHYHEVHAMILIGEILTMQDIYNY